MILWTQFCLLLKHLTQCITLGEASLNIISIKLRFTIKFTINKIYNVINYFLFYRIEGIAYKQLFFFNKSRDSFGYKARFHTLFEFFLINFRFEGQLNGLHRLVTFAPLCLP